MRKSTAIALAAAMTLSMIPTAAYAEDEVKSVRIGAPYDPVTMDYAELNVDPATWLDTMVGETLLRCKQGEYIGGLADSWEVSEDGRIWTFTLKEGLTYSDGETPVTTEDLLYAVKRVLDPEEGHYNAESGFIIENAEQYYSGECEWDEVGVEVIDDLNIRYTFKNPQYESAFTSNTLFSPLEEAVVSGFDANAYGTAADKILTDGPFVITDWTSDSSMTLKKNENYWDADSIPMDEVTIVFNVSGDTGVDMMMADEIDFVPTSGKNQNQTLADAGFESTRYTTSYRCLNLCHGGKTEESGLFLSNANFRKALNYAIDRNALCASVMTNDQPATRLTAPTEAGINGMFDEEFEYEGWPASGDPQKAKEYLDLALTELGKTIDDVPALDLLCYEAQGSIDVLSAIQDMFRTNLGIESNVNPQTIQVMISSAMSGDYDLWYGGNGLNIPDAMEGFLNGYTSSMCSPLRGYSNEEFDKLYDTAMASPTIEERKTNYFDVEKFFCDNTLNIILGWTDGGYNYKSGYTGFYNSVDTDFTYLDYAE